MRINMILAVAITALSPLSAASALAQGAGVCDRQANQLGQGIANDAAGKISGVSLMNLPPDEAQAMILIYSRVRDRAFMAVEQMRANCTMQYIPYQNMANYVVAIYTAGLSQYLPPQYTYVDVSEIINGYPLGGPTAVIPQARDQVLNGLGVGGDAAKIIRDPKQILPWNW